MIKFNYTIKDRAGLHARQVVLLANECKKYNSKVYIQKDNLIIQLKDLVEVLKLNIKYNDIIEIQIEGEDEELTEKNLKKYLNKKL